MDPRELRLRLRSLNCLLDATVMGINALLPVGDQSKDSDPQTALTILTLAVIKANVKASVAFEKEANEIALANEVINPGIN